MAKKNIGMTIGLIAVLVILGLLVGGMFGWIPVKQTGLEKEVITEQKAATLCPTDGDSSLKINVQNRLNTTGQETFDVTGYLYKVIGEEEEFVTSISDTTSPSATLMDCGFDYVFKPVASDSDSGDNTNDIVVLAGKATAKDGEVKFSATRSNVDITLGMEQHGILQFRVKDLVDDRFSVNTTENGTSNWQSDGVTFADGDEQTAYAISSETDRLDFEYHLRGTSSETDFEDKYVLILVETGAAKTVWETPVVSYNGVDLNDIKANGLTAEEKDSFDAYEYIYKLPVESIKNSEKVFRITMQPQTGQNPTADVEIDFASAGNYLSVDGVTVKSGAAKDDTANTAVFTLMDTAIDVS